jgi:hypothetical protein
MGLITLRQQSNREAGLHKPLASGPLLADKIQFMGLTDQEGDLFSDF